MRHAETLRVPVWSVVMPLLGLLMWVGLGKSGHWAAGVVIAALLVGGVISAVRHAEAVALRVGEPFGTLVLTLSVTSIEVSLIVALMLNADPNPALVRDTMVAVVFLVVHGVAGLCIVVGTLRHREQEFRTAGASAFLTVLLPMVVLVLVLPNFTFSTSGPFYTPGQLAFVAVVCLLLYLSFLFVQTMRHRDYFLPASDAPAAREARPRISRFVFLASLALLPVALVAVALLAKSMAVFIEDGLEAMRAPEKLTGVIVAAIVLAPETGAALRAAYGNRLQTSINVALGSALASIGLTVPVVAAISLGIGHQLNLGVEPGSMVLLSLSFLMAMLTYGRGSTNLLSGLVHLVLLACYVFLIFAP